MKLTLERQPSHLTCTVGSLFVNGEFECFTLEDVVREIRGVPVERWKVAGKTAIPAGTYPLTITESPRFKRLLPLIADVPGFSGVRIHTGNSDVDTEGCVLVGMQVGAERESIAQSRVAFGRLFDKLQAALSRGEEIEIEIKNGFD